MDIPQGSIPLRSHEQTQILNVSINGYNTRTFEREFYFPQEGEYATYPANASKNQAIISKGQPLKKIQVVKVQIASKQETLDNILRSGTSEQVFSFLSTKNIFDQNVFNPALIIWKLTDADFYRQVLKIFR